MSTKLKWHGHLFNKLIIKVKPSFWGYLWILHVTK